MKKNTYNRTKMVKAMCRCMSVFLIAKPMVVSAEVSYNSVMDKINDAQNGVLVGEASNANTILTIVDGLVQKDGSGNNVYEATVALISNAQAELDAAKAQLAIINTEAGNASDSIDDINAKVTAIQTELDAAIVSATGLADTVSNATDKAWADSAIASLEELISNTGTNYETAKTDIAGLERDYNTAIAGLDLAESTFLTDLANAKTDSSAAVSALNSILLQLDSLKTEISGAVLEIEASNSSAQAVITVMRAAADNNYNGKASLENVYLTIMREYYIPQVIGASYSSISNISITKHDGIASSLDYYVVSYNADGNSYERFFNYACEPGVDGSIVIFEKDPDERAIDDYLRGEIKRRYGNNPTDEQIADIVDNYGVYTMEYNGALYFAIMKKASAGSYTELVNDANNTPEYYAAGNGLVQSTNSGLKSYIAIIEKYNSLLSEIQEVYNLVNESAGTANAQVVKGNGYSDSIDSLKLAELKTSLDASMLAAKTELTLCDGKMAELSAKLTAAKNSAKRFEPAPAKSEDRANDTVETKAEVNGENNADKESVVKAEAEGEVKTEAKVEAKAEEKNVTVDEVQEATEPGNLIVAAVELKEISTIADMPTPGDIGIYLLGTDSTSGVVSVGVPLVASENPDKAEVSTDNRGSLSLAYAIATVGVVSGIGFACFRGIRRRKLSR